MNEVFKLGVMITTQDLITSKLSTITDQWEKLKERFKDFSEIEGSMKKLENGILSKQVLDFKYYDITSIPYLAEGEGERNPFCSANIRHVFAGGSYYIKHKCFSN